MAGWAVGANAPVYGPWPFLVRSTVLYRLLCGVCGDRLSRHRPLALGSVEVRDGPLVLLGGIPPEGSLSVRCSVAEHGAAGAARRPADAAGGGPLELVEHF